MPTTELSHRFERIELLPHDEQIRVLKQEIERINKWNLRLQRAFDSYLLKGDKLAAMHCLKNDGAT